MHWRMYTRTKQCDYHCIKKKKYPRGWCMDSNPPLSDPKDALLLNPRQVHVALSLFRSLKFTSQLFHLIAVWPYTFVLLKWVYFLNCQIHMIRISAFFWWSGGGEEQGDQIKWFGKHFSKYNKNTHIFTSIIMWKYSSDSTSEISALPWVKKAKHSALIMRLLPPTANPHSEGCPASHGAPSPGSLVMAGIQLTPPFQEVLMNKLESAPGLKLLNYWVILPVPSSLVCHLPPTCFLSYLVSTKNSTFWFRTLTPRNKSLHFLDISVAGCGHVIKFYPTRCKRMFHRTFDKVA